MWNGLARASVRLANGISAGWLTAFLTDYEEQQKGESRWSFAAG